MAIQEADDPAIDGAVVSEGGPFAQKETDWHRLYEQERAAREQAEQRLEQFIGDGALAVCAQKVVLHDAPMTSAFFLGPEGHRHRLAAIVEASEDAILSSTLDGVIIAWNASAERIFGYSAEEIIGRSRTLLFPPDQVAEDPCLLKRIRAGGRVERHETIRVRKDGTLLHVLLTISPIRNDHGHVIGVSTLARDIGEMTRLNTLLRESERSAHTVAEAIMAGARCILWYADIEDHHDGPLLWWNLRLADPDGARRFLPLALREGESFREGWYRSRVAEDRARCDLHGTACIRAGESYVQEFRCILADGTVRWLHEDVRVETIEPGNRWRAIGVCTDTTEQNSTRDRIVRLNERLRLNIQETHHHVKNNLQVLSALIDNLMFDYDDALPIDQVKRLSSQILILASIHELLMRAPQASDETERELPSDAVLARLITLLKTTLRGTRIQVSIVNVDLSVRQATALALIVNELVLNGAKHGEREVHVRFHSEQKDCVLEVENDGEAFPAGFDVDANAGAGLTLVAALVRHDLQGQILFGGKEAGGARVLVIFPCTLP